MTQRVRYIGIPGSGKTTKGMEVIAKVRERGFTLMQIGYCTFTRAARREAANRAAETFDVKIDSLEKAGWFRTIHSCCMRLLGIPRGVIVNSDRDWLRAALQDQNIQSIDDEEDDELWTRPWRGQSPATYALSLWDVARSRLLPFDAVWEEAMMRSMRDNRRDWREVEWIIRAYELAKQKDERLDFTDVLLRYIGIKMTLAGPETIEPQGDVPPVPVWILDECQDTSPLLDRAAQRLTANAIWIYLLGDANQGIYGWSGADPYAFLRWPVAHEEHLMKSWRCSRKILDLGLNLLRLSNDEPSRAIRSMPFEARQPGGTIDQDWEENLTHHLSDPTKATLVMARTNLQAQDIQRRLSAAEIPWKSVKGSQRWPPLAATRTSDVFATLERGEPIDGDGWRRIVAAVPAALLKRGTKKRFTTAASKSEADFVTLLSLKEYGGTDALATFIEEGQWRAELPQLDQAHIDARRKWGDLVDQPMIQVGTIHSTKGMESAKVVLCTGIGKTIQDSLFLQEGLDEERRVWYVGATRAKDDLVLLRGQRWNYEDIYDALGG